MPAGSILDLLILWLDVGMLLLALMVAIIPGTIADDLREQPFMTLSAMAGIVALWPLKLYGFLRYWKRHHADTE